jgi:hypothetical protein
MFLGTQRPSGAHGSAHRPLVLLNFDRQEKHKGTLMSTNIGVGNSFWNHKAEDLSYKSKQKTRDCKSENNLTFAVSMLYTTK